MYKVLTNRIRALIRAAGYIGRASLRFAPINTAVVITLRIAEHVLVLKGAPWHTFILCYNSYRLKHGSKNAQLYVPRGLHYFVRFRNEFHPAYTII